ncbi:uncharacterized protein LOC114742162 [Neltuma alba]|uniref:uncharacterized protein LOC114742162 n=1 Tax=Neltuma alba TaxID=207710 RepID=UPI0010A30867|nr:uncharacterized protein LOC114742162 [Prosopis alba]
MAGAYLALLQFLFVLITQLLCGASSQPEFQDYYCSNSSNTANSTYQNNLNTLLSNLTSNKQIDYGFYNLSYGSYPNTIYAVGLCRGDVMPDFCRGCLKNSSVLLPQLCPNQKQAFGMYDECMLSYSDTSIVGNRVDLTVTVYMWNVNSAKSWNQYNQVLTGLLRNLSSRAASGDSSLKFAAGNEEGPDLQHIYAVVQCTPNLNESECNACLLWAISKIPDCCKDRPGGRVITPICNFRYESSRFYAITADVPLSAPSPLPSPPLPPLLTPPSLPSTNTTSSSPPPYADTTSSEGKKSQTVIAIVVPTSAFVVLLICVWICVRVRNQGRKLPSEIDADDSIDVTESIQFEFDTIKVATNNFSDENKLGQGGFGPVYEGKLSSGKEVAVKRLSTNSGQGDVEFKNEVQVMVKLQHRNLVRLLGFCLKEKERLLVYELLPNKSLDHFIFDPIRRAQLRWETRYKIIEGIARGLLYLHEESQQRIIHRDLKASNILLDTEMNLKISDFGIARLVIIDQTQANTNRVVGTYGYMAPEYARHGRFSTKSDVFSFGVLILEIVSGQKNGGIHNMENVEHLPSLAWKSWRKGIASKIIDPMLKSGSRNEIMRCLHIGLLCVQEKAAERPPLASLVLMLSSHSFSLHEPMKPAFFMNDTSLSDRQSGDYRYNKSAKSLSINEASITDIYPRSMARAYLALLQFLCVLITQFLYEAISQPELRYHYCSSSKTASSTYQTNLNTLLSNLTSNKQIDYGFYNLSYGSYPNTIYAVGLCRGDVMPELCRSCLKNSSVLLPQLCPNQKQAFGMYDECMLSYSDTSILGNRVDPIVTVYMWNVNFAKSWNQYNQVLTGLLRNLSSRAASGDSSLKFAAGNEEGPDLQNIYAVVQCTPNLNESECNNCLLWAISQIPVCCNDRPGGRVVTPICNFRYESSRFYAITADVPLSAPSPLLSPPPPPLLTPPSLPSTNTTSSSPPPYADTTSSEGKESQTIIAIVVPTSALVGLLICVWICVRVRRQGRKFPSEIGDHDSIDVTESIQFEFDTIKVATNNFSDENKLGQGGFGPVYKGKLSSGKEIAVKRLAGDSGQGDIEFKNEVQVMVRLQHRNLVRLLGFCLKQKERLLVYELLPNKSLDHFIFDPIRRAQLRWETRYKIIEGIARGLLYLHEESQQRIIHRDLKASNILLDMEMNPKISDFGMARLVIIDQTQANTNRVVGTYGYMAPEYARHGRFSTKSDVFSFGVLILEIVSGQKNGGIHNMENVEHLPSLAWKSWRKGIASNIIDPTLKDGSRNEIMRCLQIGLLCVQEKAADRPTLASLVLMLSSHSFSLQEPMKPAFFMNDISLSGGQSGDYRYSKSSKSLSVNEASITDIYPR